MTVSLAQANALIAAAVAHGTATGLAPLTVAVLDPASALVAFSRADGSPSLRPQLAIGKAAGALGLGTTSRRIGEMAVERPHFVAALGPVAPHGLIPAAGGLRFAHADGTLAGAIGISGDTSDNDELVARAAIEAVGLVALG